MVDWKVYTIENKTVESGIPHVIIFELNRYVKFSDCPWDSIFVMNVPPFSDWQIGDKIEIDNERTQNELWGNRFNDTSIMRKFGSSANVVSIRGPSSDIVISSDVVNAVGNPQTMELARHMSRMVDENDKEYEFKIEDTSNKRFTYSLICRKQK